MEVTTTLGIPSVVRYQGTVLAEEDTSSTDGLTALESVMRLMPNPVHHGDLVTLGRDGQPVNWTLWNMQGACVLQGRSADMNTEELDAGVYLVRDERHGTTRRLVIQ
jgi:chemotaxis response regulator CheB